MLVLHHARKRKLAMGSKKYQKSLMDHLIYLFAFAGPIMTIPQIYDIWIKRDMTVNIITWTGYVIINMVWLAYGSIHKDKPIVYSNVLAIITNTLVVVGSMMH